MLKVIYLSLLCFAFSGSVKASDILEELDFARKGVVSCETKENVLKYVKGEVLSVCDVINQVKQKIDPSKVYFLNLQDNSINNKAALEILQFVRNEPQIKKIDLSYNRINQMLDTSKIQEECNLFVSQRPDCAVILTGNNIPHWNFYREDDAPKKVGSNIIIEAF